MKIYTRAGDDGTTGLLYGGRVPKDDLRPDTCGGIDEAVAAIGLARSLQLEAEGLADLLFGIQRQLFVVAAEVATAPENAHKLKAGISKVTDDMVAGLEGSIDALIELSPLPNYFVLPGGCPCSAALDLARSMVRRAERSAVALRRQGLIDDVVAQYLNRVSDLLFVAARYEEHARGLQAPPSHD